jgi:anti-sigma factor RsiW
MERAVLTADPVTPDVLRDYLDGRLSQFERQRIERAVQEDREIAQAIRMIKEGTEVIRARLELQEEIPVEWLAIISRWDLPVKS